MKTSKLVLFLSTLFILSCSSDVNVDFSNDFPNNNNCLQGQGNIVSESRSLADFNSVNSMVVADIFLSQGPKEDIIIEAQQNILDILKTDVVNDELRISTSRCVSIFQRIKVYVIIPDIRNLTLTGVGDFRAENDFDLNELNLTLTGTGNFNLKGITEFLDIVITGVGDIKAFQLDSQSCDVVITGVGDVEVSVSNTLNINISGTGSVFYTGNPVINSNITGSGNVIDAN